eukprot:COSAG02_NODE_967_length_15586_cov_9.185704_11_plen_178_part_00
MTADGGPSDYAPNIGGSPWEENMRAAMEDYACPAGSVVIFTESLIHAANDWTNPANRRVAIFNCYNSVCKSPLSLQDATLSIMQNYGWLGAHGDLCINGCCVCYCRGTVAQDECTACRYRADGSDEAEPLPWSKSPAPVAFDTCAGALLGAECCVRVRTGMAAGATERVCGRQPRVV